MLSAIALALALGSSDVVIGQTDLSLSALLQNLHAADWTTRAEAVEHLIAQPQLWNQRETRSALVQLLDRENRWMRDPHRTVASDPDDTAYVQYYSALLGRVGSFVDSRDVKAVGILAQSVYNPDSTFALKLASYGQTAAPALLRIAADPDLERASDPYEVLGQVLRFHRSGSSRHPLTSQTVRDIEDRLTKGLHSAAPFVRGSAIRGVKATGDSRWLPTLEDLRTSDPYILDGTTRYWIREQAEKAIASIRADPLNK